MKTILILFSSLFCAFAQINTNKIPRKIAFGSCGDQDHPQPVLSLAASKKPNLFIFLGDNIYGDSDILDTLKAKYHRWQAQSHFQNLSQNVPIIATWDDHDFGRNDAGSEYPLAEPSKDLFLSFFNEPLNSERRNHKGIYTSYYFKEKGKTVQILLLDNRTFRSELLKYDGRYAEQKKFFYELDYAPHADTATTILGKEQWKWLERELKQPADLRIIGSGSQFGISFNGYEAWANFPHEQQRFLNLVKMTKANGVVFLTGDVHYAEISKLNTLGQYPIYDVTASGITSTWHFATPNSNRVEGPIMENHFGQLTLNLWAKRPHLVAEIIDVADNQRIEHKIFLDEIRF